MLLTKDSILRMGVPEHVKILTTPTTDYKTIEEVVTDSELHNAAIAWVKDPANKALGLASNQLKESGDTPRSWFVIKMNRTGEVRLIINPKILGGVGRKQYIESCFSEAHSAIIKRMKQMTLEHGLDKIREILSVQDTQVTEHEVGHLRGFTICGVGRPLYTN